MYKANRHTLRAWIRWLHRKVRWSILGLFFGVSLIHTCSPIPTRQHTISSYQVSPGEEPELTITNPGRENMTFRWSINEAFPLTRSDLLPWAMTMYSSEDTVAALWQLTYHLVKPQTTALPAYLYQYPELVINSIGYGNCGDQSAVLAHLWLDAGYPARIWPLEGHVVPEVKRGTGWSVYDPNTGVRFLDADGEVASFQKIHPQHNLEMAPIGSSIIFPPGHPFQDLVHLDEYDPEAGYRSPKSADTLEGTWMLPPMASMTCCREGTWPDGTPNRQLSVHIPAGSGGTLYVPLWQITDPGSAVRPGPLEVSPANQERTFTFAVNPFLPLWQEQNQLHLTTFGNTQPDIHWTSVAREQKRTKPLLALPIPWEDPNFTDHFARFEAAWNQFRPGSLSEIFQVYLDTSKGTPAIRDSLMQQFQRKHTLAVELLGAESMQHAYSDQRTNVAFQFLQCYQIWHRLPMEYNRYYWQGMARILADRH